MLYAVGNRLVCKKQTNAKCLEMTNPDIDINVGDVYVVTDKDDYPDDNESHWYELISDKDANKVLNAWNDKGHLIVDETFDKL